MTEYSSEDVRKGVEQAFKDLYLYHTGFRGETPHAIEDGVKEAAREWFETNSALIPVYFKDAVENAVLQYLRENPKALGGRK